VYPLSKDGVRRSTKPGEIPALSVLKKDELAYNLADGKLYAKRIVDGVEVIVDLTGSEPQVMRGVAVFVSATEPTEHEINDIWVKINT
jgi:hypothetical protein